MKQTVSSLYTVLHATCIPKGYGTNYQHDCWFLVFVFIFLHFVTLGVCIIDDDRLIDHIDDLEGAFTAWQVCESLLT